MRTPIALLFLLLLTACDDTAVTKGYVEVVEPNGQIQKVNLSCRTIYDTDQKTLSITGVTLPITSVIKPEIGGVSTGINPQILSDQLHGLDLQQLAMCQSLLLLPQQADIRQTIKDYIGASGNLTQQIRTLNSSTSVAQYQQTANNLANNATATVAKTTADAMTTPQVQAKVIAPQPAVFPTQPSLSEPPNPATSTPPAQKPG